MLRNSIWIIALIICAGFMNSVCAQNSQQKTQDLIAALGKTKYKKKEKRNFTFERYIDIKSQQVVKNNLRDYAGIYQSSDSDYRIELRVAADGKVEGSGSEIYFENSNFDNQRKRNFTLKDAKIEGALLTATKVYANGATEKFEAVFNNQTIVEGKNPNEIESREVRYGLGFLRIAENFQSRIFCEFKQ